MMKPVPPQIDGHLRKFSLRVPEVIRKCSGIIVFGKRIKSLVFTTDVCIIRNVNADAIFAVYPFTPQPIITDALLLASDIPVFSGIGGGLTRGQRVVTLAQQAEAQGSTGVVVNAPTENEVIQSVADVVDIPVVVTVVAPGDDYKGRVESGAAIFNVSASSRTPEVVREIRRVYPEFPIIATGGPTDDTIEATIEAGANAIVWTPPTNASIFHEVMSAYREGRSAH